MLQFSGGAITSSVMCISLEEFYISRATKQSIANPMTTFKWLKQTSPEEMEIPPPQTSQKNPQKLVVFVIFVTQILVSRMSQSCSVCK